MTSFISRLSKLCNCPGLSGKIPLIFRLTVNNVNVLIQQNCKASTSKRWSIEYPRQEVMVDTTEEDKSFSKRIITKVNDHITASPGRLFAIVHLAGKQFRVAEEDILMIEGYYAPTVSDILKFQKILLVAGSSFTLIGRPLVPSNLVSITATVVEKDLGHTRIVFKHKRSAMYKRTHFVRKDITTLRINKIEVYPNVDKMNEMEDVDRV